MIKEKVAEMKALQKSKAAYEGWRQTNHNELPTNVRFIDADGNPTNKKLVILDAKMAKENPDLVIRNMAQDTKDLNHCVGSCGMDNGKYVPMVEPHTGVAKKAGSEHGPNYLKRIKSGEMSIASLRDSNGESKATFELSLVKKEVPKMRFVDVDGQTKVEVKHGWESPNEKKYFDTNEEANQYVHDYMKAPNQFKIGQLKGLNNKQVVGDEYINDAKNWLNEKRKTGELTDFPFEDIKNLPGVYDLGNQDSLLALAKSEDPKARQASALYDEAMRNKLKENPKLKSNYQKGFISSVDIMSPELNRFVTADDIIAKFGTE